MATSSQAAVTTNVAPDGGDTTAATQSLASSGTDYIYGIKMCDTLTAAGVQSIVGMQFDITSSDGTTQTSNEIGTTADPVTCTDATLTTEQCFTAMTVYMSAEPST